MPVILVRIPRSLGFGRIVGAAVISGLLARQRRVRCNNRAALQQVQLNLALQVNGEAQVRPRRKHNHPAASARSGFNCSVDALGVERFSITNCPKAAHVEDALRRRA